MKTIILAILLLYTISATPQCLDLDVMLVGDFSGSVQNYEPYVADAFTAFITALELGEETTQMGIVAFASEPTLITALSSDKAKLLVRASLMKADYKAEGGTNLLLALQMASNELLGNGRPGFRKIVIVISDGEVENPEGTMVIAQQLQSLGIQICAVLINNNTTQPQFMQQLSGGCYAESSYSTLADELKKLDMCL